MIEPRHTVLLVDDDSTMVETLRWVLRDQGYRVLTATQPSDALKILDGGGVDLILSDIDMPEMTGVELLAQVRKSHPEVVRMLLTGGASLETALRAINDGEVYRYLTKPCDNGVLRDTIRQALDRIDELRHSAASEQAARQRVRMLEELRMEHPGIDLVQRSNGVYLIDAERLDEVAATLRSPGLKLFFGP